MRLSIRRIGLLAAGLALLAGGALHLVGQCLRTSGPLAQGAYVWQRRWTEELASALERSSERMDRFLVLAAEVEWRGEGEPRIVRPGIDWAALAGSKRPVGLALRIGPCRGPFERESATTARLVSLALSIRDDARAGGIEPAELQLDFDCASERLDGYRSWVTALRAALAPTPLTFTALPSWLNRSSFVRLAEAADGFVLQVHSLDAPASPAEEWTLCAPARARQWVEEAGRLGLPFRVALPTYGYELAFSPEGRLLGLTAEGESPRRPAGTQLRPVESDPAAMAGLVRAWTESRPACLAGILWYRLPVEGEKRNWRWPTFAAVLEGRAPREGMRLRVEQSNPALATVLLENPGERMETAPNRVRIRWEGAALLAADSFHGFRLAEEAGGILFESLPDGGGLRLPPGDSLRIGWLRFRGEAHVAASLDRP